MHGESVSVDSTCSIPDFRDNSLFSVYVGFPKTSGEIHLKDALCFEAIDRVLAFIVRVSDESTIGKINDCYKYGNKICTESLTIILIQT